MQELNIDLKLIQKPFSHEKLPHISQRKIIKTVLDLKSENGVGSAFCILNDFQVIKTAKFKLSKYCSVFQSQMFEILNQMKYINKKLAINTSLTIGTDSQSAIKALQNPNSTTQLVQEILPKVRTAEENKLK